MKHNIKLTPYSQKLRKEMTKEERHLWYDFLKNVPVVVNRQKVIGNYIVDFFCNSAKVVIELDGGQHFEKDAIEYDAERDKYLSACGLTVLRYTNLDINKRFDEVCADVWSHIIPHPSFAPQMPPSPKGKAECPCKRDCVYHGKCGECIEQHKTKKYLPACKRKAKKILETERLFLREMTQADFADLCEILQDKETMYAYEHAFSDGEAQDWLDRQLERYKNDGFGLWAVIHKESGEFVGQCGITWQDIDGEAVPEIGYLFKRKYWHNGYATEAAQGCKNYAFDTLGFDRVYSIIRDNNYASQRVAERNGMTVVKTFTKHYYSIDMPHLVYRTERRNKK